MNGSCLCGAVTFTLTGQPRDVIACHCTQCRKTSGHFVAATSVPDEDLQVTGEAALTWYRSSPEAQRAFCSVCGSQLFWKPANTDRVSVMAGSLDGATGLTISKQIFCADKGDYYDLPDVPMDPAG